MTGARVSSSSFRDPSGFIFEKDGVLYRQVNAGYEQGLDLLEGSGLYDELSRAGLLVPHQRVPLEMRATDTANAVIAPERIPLISYPYEWSFSQLKEAALLTLDVMRRAIAKGLSLKDASAYNVQFFGCRPIFIDTLSFEAYKEGEPWVAYKQFCQHFLAPLALMSLADIRLGSLLRTHIDGIPLDLTSRLLPRMTKFQPGLLAHIHLHARAQESNGRIAERRPAFSKTSLLALIDSLRGTVSGLSWKPTGTEWGDYYSDTNYTPASFDRKREIVADMLSQLDVQTCWDLGANNGAFSQLAVERGLQTTAWDIDPAAVEKAYQHGKQSKESKLLPLLQDLRNPSEGIGWAGRERGSFVQRGPAGALLALALIHHLAIGNNVPLPMIASFFAELGDHLIIEFVPKEDSQVQRMLVAREDIFGGYTQEGFEAAFGTYFSLSDKQAIDGTLRTLYLYKKAGA